MKGYVINLYQKEINISEDFSCKFHCAQTLVSSLLVILIAFFLIGWSQSFINWVQKKIPGKNLLPNAIVLKVFGLVMLIIVTMSITYTCACILKPMK